MSLIGTHTLATPHIDINRTLVDRCRSGDSKAQYELYHMYAKAMYNVCMRIVNHEGEAEDILQDSFVDAFHNIGSFRGESTIGAWLKKIVVNRSVNSLRKRRLVLFEEVPDTETVQPERVTAEIDGTALNVQLVHKAISELPDGYRVVLSLYLIEGYDHQEIAQILDITEATSKSQYHRAKNKVREKLKRYEG